MILYYIIYYCIVLYMYIYIYIHTVQVRTVYKPSLERENEREREIERERVCVCMCGWIDILMSISYTKNQGLQTQACAETRRAVWPLPVLAKRLVNDRTVWFSLWSFGRPEGTKDL